MSLYEDTFPGRVLGAEEQQFIITQCGGIPAESLESIRSFLASNGVPMLSALAYRRHFETLRRASICELSTELATEEAGRAFNRGALLYAAMFRLVNNRKELPFRSDVMGRIMDEEARDFALRAYEGIQEVDSFGVVFDQLRPAIAETDAHRQFGMVGAGALHVLVEGALEGQRREELMMLEDMWQDDPTS